MSNIFENAKFGDLYVTEDGIKNSFCSFTKSGNDKLARLYREGWGIVICYLDGSIHSGYGIGKGSIKCKYIEPIYEEELDRLAEEFADEAIRKADLYSGLKLAFKEGYRKAKEE